MITDRINQFLRTFQGHMLTHEILASFMGVTCTGCWLIAWYLLRSERIENGNWKPQFTLGWVFVSFLFWIGLLMAYLSLLVMFSDNPLPYEAIILFAFIFVSTMALLKVYAKEELK